MQNNVQETPDTPEAPELSAAESYSKNNNLLKIMLTYCSPNDLLSFSSSCSNFHEVSQEQIANVFKEKCNNLIVPNILTYSYIFNIYNHYLL